MSGRGKDRSRKPKRKDFTAVITEEPEDGSSEDDNAQPANPQAQHQASFPGAQSRPTDTSKGAAAQDTSAATKSLEVPGAAPKSKSALARVGTKISALLRRTPPKSQSGSASPQKKVATERHWAPEEHGSPGTSAVAEETTMELPVTPPEPHEPDWTNPRLITCPPELYGPLFDPFNVSGPVERIPLDPTKGALPPSMVDPAPLATVEDLCSPAGEDFEQRGAGGAAAPPTSRVTRARVHGSDEPPRRSPTPPPRVPPPQPEVPPPEPEERKLRPRRKGEPKR